MADERCDFFDGIHMGAIVQDVAIWCDLERDHAGPHAKLDDTGKRYDPWYPDHQEGKETRSW